MREVFARLIDPPAFRAWLRGLRAPQLRLALRLCLPAVVIGIVLRAVVLFHMPFAFVHNDTADLVETPEVLLTKAGLHIEGKKTFLVPFVYCVPALLHLPILGFLAVFQHLLGIANILLCGLLTFCWLRCWKWLIVPITILMALQPVLLWYEHAALAEIYAITGLLLVALCATLFARQPNRYSLGMLLAALLFMAGARPEGQLFALFSIVLVARVLWGKWREFGIGVSVVSAWTAFLFLITKTGQSGLLLFTSVVHLSPPTLWFSPGVAEATAPIAAEAARQWNATPPAPKLVPLRKDLQKQLIDWQVEQGIDNADARKRVNTLARRAGMEIALRNLTSMPTLAVEKFVIAHRELPALGFGDYAVEGQLDALTDDGGHAMESAPLLWHHPMESAEDARAFLVETYRPLPGNFADRLQEWWVSFSLCPLLPIVMPGSQVDRVPVGGLPWLYAAGLLGILCLAIRDREPLGFHQLWGAFLIAIFVLIMVTANIRARFRVIFEPFWILYAFALLDSLLILTNRLRPSRRPATPAQ